MQASARRWAPVIGVVGADAAAVVESVAEAGGDASVVDGQEARDASAVIALGESALLSLVRDGVRVPVLPVGVGGGVRDVSRDTLSTAIEELVEAELETIDQPLLEATVDDREYTALMDVMTVTTEPAKISEYSIETGAEDNERTVDRVRADGVVVATATGTPGYSSTAGGPVLAPGVDGVSVVPVGPFRVEQTHWVLDLPVSLTVARDEVPVSLLVDDEEVGRVPAHSPIELRWGEPLPIVRTTVTRTEF